MLNWLLLNKDRWGGVGHSEDQDCIELTQRGGGMIIVACTRAEVW